MAKAKTGYLGNTNLKQEHEIVSFTLEEVNEYKKCMLDPIYFIKKYVKIISLDHGLVNFELFDYQVRFIKAIHENRKVIGMFPRQFGKTICVSAYLCWYLLFNDDKTVAILANKATAAREIMSRMQLIYEHLPKWLQHGIKEWNKGSVRLSNGQNAFTAATSSSGIRGKSCVTLDTKVCVHKNGDIFYAPMSLLLNNSNFIYTGKDMKYVIYKTTNNINGKIYYGYHQCSEMHIIRKDYGSGSCFSNGYLGSGKLIKRAIEKYTPDNFSQEIVQIFDTKEEAEKLEAQIVNAEFTLREDTYNVALGGNVRVMVGENNPFFGKTHSQETINKIKEKNANFIPYQTVILNNETKETYKGYHEVLAAFDLVNFDGKNTQNKRQLAIHKLVYEGKITLLNPRMQKFAMEKYKEHIDYVNSSIERKEKTRLLQSQIRTGFVWKEESKEKLSIAIKKWITEHPEEHQERMLKINKNPDKIAKMAEKHRGMKRSEESRKRISESKIGAIPKNVGCIEAYHPITLKTKYFKTKEEIPLDWIIGCNPNRTKKRGKVYNNGIENKVYLNFEDVPLGWCLGRMSKIKKDC